MLLVIYPLWDAIVTLLERRIAGTAPMDRVGATNVALGLATTAGMIAAAFATIGTALLVFGIWALLSGAIQLIVAIRRRRTVGAQWPMAISGGLSVLAGASFAAMSASATGSLTAVDRILGLRCLLVPRLRHRPEHPRSTRTALTVAVGATTTPGATTSSRG
ncbi:DUF308 domain-containing protein [Streptomyces sp. NPDC051909]|uniref:DUF308 domain-containing protein n=1 Tax=Streptomyces sp. NPDC051909 TaxID=3154944 RepID=UPI00341C7A02